MSCNGLLTVTDQGNNRVQQFALAAPAQTSCGVLPALGTPPPPKVPTLPPAPGPELTVKVLRRSSLLSQRNLPLRVRCDTVCTLKLTGTLSERSAPRPAKGKKRRKPVSVDFLATTRELAAGQSGVIRARLSAKDVRTLRRALKRRRGLAATLQLSATSAAGEVTEESQGLDALG